jgi:hypothetical protein
MSDRSEASATQPHHGWDAVTIADSSGELQKRASGEPTDKGSPSDAQASCDGGFTVMAGNQNVPQCVINGSVPQASSDFSTIFVFWPRGLLNFGLFDAFKSGAGVFVDDQPIGSITGGDYVTAKISSGKHVLSIKDGVGFLGGGSEQNVVLGSGRTSYYRITYTNKYFEITELGPEQGAPDLSGLRKK